MRIIIVSFKDLIRWDVKYFLAKLTFKKDLIELKEVIVPKNEKIKKDSYKGDYEIVEKIAFDNGQVYFRSERKTGMDLYKADKGNLLTSKINLHQGAVALCPKDLVCSTHYYVYEIKEEKIIPEYLILILRSAPFLNAIESLKASSIKNEIGPSFLLDLRVYVPSLVEQQKIVDQWNKAQQEAQELKEKATAKEKAIDDYILSELGIEKKEYQKKKGAFVVRFKDLERWGINFNSYDWNLDNLFETKKYATERIGKIAKINQTYLFLKDKLNQNISFIPMENVSDIEGRVEKKDIRKLSEVINGYTRFVEGDIIFAKITPCMENGKCAIADGLENGIGIGSTEFHVLTPDKNLIETKYLWNILRLKFFRKSAKRYFIGSVGQQRVPVDFLEKIKIPILPISIQQEIIQKVDEMREEIVEIRKMAETILENTKREIGQMLEK